MKHPYRFVLLTLILLGLTPIILAQTIEQTLPSGKVAIADFRQGDSNKPAVLIVHGFLTTHNFNTIRSTVEMFEENDITVLAPTLTLGINHRNKGMPCSAIQTHSMSDSVDEIEFWVNWLNKKTRQKITLLGHSMASVQVLAFSESRSLDKVKRIVPLSLIYVDGFSPAEKNAYKKHIAQAKKMLKSGVSMPSVFSLSYCRNSFTSLPDVFLSYAEWNQQRVLRTIRKLKIPRNIIMASEDRYYGTQWQTSLKKADPQTTIIQGAGHFFDGPHEFDLHDILIEIVNRP